MSKEELLQYLKLQNFSREILGAFEKVQRENFVLPEFKKKAYENIALPIGHFQTISQPYTIAMMLSMLKLKKNQKVLEIGSGCGYVLALLSEIVGKSGKVFGVEIIKELSEQSKVSLKDYENVQIYNCNGVEGLQEKALFDRILISASLEKVPEKILNQLKDNGILVAPLGPIYEQTLTTIQKKKNKFVTQKEIPGFIFVPFVNQGESK